MTSCSQPSGYTSDNTDCDDNDNDIFPGALELCNGVDDNCDQTVDEDTATDAATWYLDNDSDGYGDFNSSTMACAQPTGYVSDSTDCNDTDGAISPIAVETCDGIDNNCNGDVDGDATVNLTTYFRDADQDGYGDRNTTQSACNTPIGFVSDSSDCDDFDNDIFPGASELCNGFDDNCDGAIDESTAVDATLWYTDGDGDGFGGTTSQLSCAQPSGTVANDSDCNDGNITINPAATEVCDGIDNDCDSNIDGNAVDSTVWYLDNDNDGYGNPNVILEACSQPSGYVANNSDCDDSNGNANLISAEVCDGIDNDCNGFIDDDPAIIGTEPSCLAASCADIITQNPSAQDGVYYIEDSNGQAIEASVKWTSMVADGSCLQHDGAPTKQQ